NLSQISEFSLVILTLGVGYGHISPGVGAVMLTAMILTSLVSPYVIGANDRIARMLLRPFERRRAQGESASGPLAGPASRPATDIVLLGHFRNAQAVLDQVEQHGPDL